MKSGAKELAKGVKAAKVAKAKAAKAKGAKEARAKVTKAARRKEQAAAAKAGRRQSGAKVDVPSPSTTREVVAEGVGARTRVWEGHALADIGHQTFATRLEPSLTFRWLKRTPSSVKNFVVQVGVVAKEADGALSSEAGE